MIKNNPVMENVSYPIQHRESNEDGESHHEKQEKGYNDKPWQLRFNYLKIWMLVLVVRMTIYHDMNMILNFKEIISKSHQCYPLPVRVFPV